MAIVISLLALLATFYQLYLQRAHNEKSLKPLGQIDLLDRKNQIFVYVGNNGMGPMVIDRITYIKDGQAHTSIKDCVNLNPRSYMHIAISEAGQKVILPDSHLEVFETIFENGEGEAEMDKVRMQLSPITLKVDCRDIYNNKFTFERNLAWFSRHMLSDSIRMKN